MTKGFTLIELLVVVLIIGILAAIALPQYRVAVLKSKTVPLLNIMRTVMEAETEYTLSGSNATPAHIIADVDALAVELPGYTKSCTKTGEYNDCFYGNGNIGFSITEVTSYIVGWVFDAERHEILSMNMLSDWAYDRMINEGIKPVPDWQDTTARNLCEYPAHSSQASAAATVCKAICQGNPFHDGRGGSNQYKTCYFN